MEDKGQGFVMPENVSRTIGKDAQRNNIMAAKLIAEIVKTTLGPKGMDKMLVDSAGNIIVTNDGVTILEEMELEHPAAKMMVDIAKTQETEVGDGTTTVALLAGKLLENAEKLLDKKIHPTIIVRGYRLAAEKSAQILEEIAKPINNKEILKQIAATAMTGKGAEGNKDLLADLIVNAVEQIAEGKNASSDDIRIQKIKGETTASSELIKGIVLDKNRANEYMPSSVSAAKILLLDFPLEIKNPDAETRISVSTPEQLEKFVESEENYLREIADIIIASGAKVIFCQKGIDDLAQYYLAKAGIMACRRVPREDMEKIARAVSCKIISNIKDVKGAEMGYSESVEETKIADDSFIYIRGCRNPKSVSIILRGSSPHSLDETERAVKDGLGDVISAVKSGRIVAGGGAVEIEIARKLRIYAKTLGSREQLAIEEFANSLEAIPEALAENAGLDPIDIITELRKSHEAGNINHGLNLFTDKIVDTMLAGIIEPIRVKSQAISSASELASIILRIDDVLISKDKPMRRENTYSGMD